MTIRRDVVALFVCVLTSLSSSVLRADQAIQYKDRNLPPDIVRVGAVLYNHVLYVVGKVEDPDDNPSGQTVYIGGSVQGTTQVGADGMFYFSIPYAYPFGYVTVWTVDRRGAQSDIEYREFAD